MKGLRGLLASAIVALFASLIIAALEVGGVINMVAVRVLLALAWCVGSVGVGVSESLTKHPPYRKAIIIMSAAVLLGLALVPLSFWIEANGPHPALAPGATPPPSGITRAPLFQHLWRTGASLWVSSHWRTSIVIAVGLFIAATTILVKWKRARGKALKESQYQYQPEFIASGPDSMEFRIFQSGGDYRWTLRAGPKHAPYCTIKGIDLRCFHPDCGMMAPSTLNVTIGIAPGITAGHLSMPSVFATPGPQHIELGNHHAPLSWPTGYPSDIERWVMGLEIMPNWKIHFCIRWVRGSKSLEFLEYSPDIPPSTF